MAAARIVSEHRLLPLTERILARLPGERVFWLAAWALVPALNAGANLLLGTDRSSAVWEQSRTLVVLNYVALGFAVLIALWGSRRIARRLETLLLETSRALAAPVGHPFRGVNGTAGPLAASAVVAVVFGVTALARDGLAPALLRGSTWFVVGIPLWTFLWTYGSVQLGLHRLGGVRLAADAGRGDPGLGVQPLGGVAFTGLWTLLVWLVPVLLTGLNDLVGVVLGALVLTAGLATFFLSLVRLHHQMVAVKRAELAIARELYAKAYEPLRAEPTLEALERQHRLLGAADALERRASAIHEWPIDEATFARVITVTTSVIAMIVGRLILDPFGL